jgi:hypothetical protein
MLEKPKKFEDLHITLYHLSARSNGKLEIRSVALSIPGQSPLVSAVRIIPGGDSVTVAVVMIDCDAGVFTWKITREFTMINLVAFSSADSVFYEMRLLEPSGHISSHLGTLTSVAPIVAEDQLSGVNMVPNHCCC